MKRIFFLLYLSLLCGVLGNADALSYTSKNVVTLSSSKHFVDQIESIPDHSIIVIKDCFDLKKGTVTIPKSCALRFDGGALINGTVVFQNTTIEGAPVLDINPKGTISGTVNAGWFGLVEGDSSFDNAPILTKVGQVFPSIFVDAGTYYCKTPIDWSNNVLTNATVDGNLVYQTANTSNVFIKVKTTRGVISFNGTIIGPTQKITDKTPKERSTGICFTDCNNSKIIVKSIGRFYKNIHVLGSSDARGNAYNDYEFVESYSAKILVHIDAEKKGWAASNVYKMLRLTWYGGQTETETALLMQGENTAQSGNFSDTVIEKLCIEGVTHSEPIKIIGANHFVIENIRNEGNYPILCYCENVVDGRISTNYGSVTIRAKNTSKVGVLTDDELVEYEPLRGSYLINGDGTYRLFNAVDASLHSTVRYSPISYTPVGIFVSNRVANVPLRILSAEPFTLDVVYYDKNKKVIANPDEGMLKPTGNVFFTKSNVNKSGFMSSSYTRDLRFVCPDGNSAVAYVGLYLRTLGNAPSPVFRMSPVIMSSAEPSVMGQQKFMSYLSSGPSTSRPTFDADDAPYMIGFSFFDTTLGKPVYVKAIAKDGTATWVDALGKQL